MNKTTRPWFACPVEAWHEIATALIASGQPWSRSTAIADLRWHADQVEVGRKDKLPGVPYFQKRWGWSQRQARKLIKVDVCDWVDSHRTVTGQLVDSHRTVPGQCLTPYTRAGHSHNNTTHKHILIPWREKPLWQSDLLLRLPRRHDHRLWRPTVPLSPGGLPSIPLFPATHIRRRSWLRHWVWQPLPSQGRTGVLMATPPESDTRHRLFGVKRDGHCFTCWKDGDGLIWISGWSRFGSSPGQHESAPIRCSPTTFAATTGHQRRIVLGRSRPLPMETNGWIA